MGYPDPTRLDVGGGGSYITALLGPTNTGKTHRAIERLIAHGGGMIGLPLRLLAREVYERLVARVGSVHVALLTGEERIEPLLARYFVCTVESMPTHMAVPFVVVDEIQLAAHPMRGHIFTDRLLNARGTRETWFLGSDTMRPLLERLVPTAVVETAERMSPLTHVAPKRLGALPGRTAVIDFSVARVYALAEQLRAVHGGVAVVLGALSPRARNAQVAMFEGGEVDYLVSTDAIGMGLNLDIRSVFFGSVRKFDGREFRELEPSELGQIAGRAGRHRREGFFGQTAECASLSRLSVGAVEMIEQQRFPAVRRVYFRHGDLDTSSIEALREGLSRQPFAPWLQHARGLHDEGALDMLLRLPDIEASVRNHPDHVALLWEVCRIPDFQQAAEGAHVRLLASIYRQLLAREGQLDEGWLEQRTRPLENAEGGIDAITARIAWTRTLAYLAHREGWVPHAPAWRARVLALEEQLSEALHQRLTWAFVDERVALTVERPRPLGVALDDEGVVTASAGPLGRVEGFSFVPDVEAQRRYGVREVRQHARAAASAPAQQRVRALLDGPDDPFGWIDGVHIGLGGQVVGALGRGQRIDAPRIAIRPLDLLDDATRHAVRARAEAWVRGQIELATAPLRWPAEQSVAPGLIWALHSALGVVAREEVGDLLAALSEADRKILARMQVRLGVHHIYSAPMLRPALQAPRAALLAAWHEVEGDIALPGGRASVTAAWPEVFARAFGYPRVGPLCVRADMLERASLTLRQRVGKGPAPLPEEPLSWIGCSRDAWAAIAASLGYRLREQGVFPPRRRPAA